MIVRTLPEWKAALQKAKASRDPVEGIPIVAYDTETVDIGYPDIHITGFSLAWYEKDGSKGGCYVPLGHQTGEMQLPAEAVQDGLADLLEDPNMRVVMHNAPYDILISRLFPRFIEVSNNVDDTMVMAFLLNTNGVGTVDQIESGNGLKGLKDLSLFYFGHKMTELTELAPKDINPKTGEKDRLRTDLVPIEKLGAYAWDDGVQTLNLRELFWYGYDEYARRHPKGVRKLSNKVRSLLPDVVSGMQNLPEIAKYYDKVEREFVHCLADMGEFGVSLDVSQIEEMRSAVEEERRSLGGKMFAARPGQDFEPWSDSQTVKRCAEEYEDLCRRYDLPKDHPDYPRRTVTKSQGRGKDKKTWTEEEPLPVGTGRRDVFKRFGLDGTPVEEKIRDDSMRPFVIEHPDLVHKIFNLNSTPKLADIFFVECECPVLGTTQSGAPSTKGDYIEEWAVMGYPVAAEMLRYREIDKLYGTYMVGMPKRVGSDGRIRTRFGRVRTGRLSSSDPNLQNIPTSDEFPIRKSFVTEGILDADVQFLRVNEDNGKPEHLLVTAREGSPYDGGYEIENGRLVRWWGTNPPRVMMVADYSQLEIRLLAHLSKDPILLKAIRDGEDIHALTARAVFDEIPDDMPLDEVKEKFPKLRKGAKPVSFGCVPMDTKALTKRGWLTYDEIEVGDETLGLKDGKLVWTRILEKVRYPDAPVVEMSAANSFRVRCTPNHRWYGDVVQADRRVEEAEFTTESMTPEHRIWTSRPADTPNESGLSAQEAAVLGCFLASGLLEYDRNEEGVYRSPEDSLLELRRKAGLSLEEWKQDELEDLILRFGSQERTAFFRALVLSALYRDDGGESQLSPEALFEVARLAAFMEGYSTTHPESDRESYTGSVLNLMHLPDVSGSEIRVREAGRENVWCVRTELGSWVMRQGDVITLTGNTIYGMGPTTLALRLGISKEEAKRLIDERYMGYYKGVKQWIAYQHNFVAAHGYIQLPTGRRRHLPEGTLDPNAPDPKNPGKTLWGRVAAAKRQSQNSPVQGLAADVIGIAMRDIRRFLRETKLDVDNPLMVMPTESGTIPDSLSSYQGQMLFRNLAKTLLQIHDELVHEYHPAVANFIMDSAVDIMESPGGMKLRVPLTVDAALGTDWHFTKE